MSHKHQYLGDLEKQDPLYEYFQGEILPHLQCYIRHPEFRVFRFWSTNNSVYLYQEKSTSTHLLGKFFNAPHGNREKGGKLACQEYHNLLHLRSYGFCNYPHKVVKPIAYNLHLNNLLLEEYQEGESLSKVLHQAAKHDKEGYLYKKLTALASFLVSMHNQTVTKNKVNFDQDISYFNFLLHQLKTGGMISEEKEKLFVKLSTTWKEHPKMWGDYQVIVHGDATPSNFIFGNEDQVTAIDLERMKHADRLFDVGRIAGEIIHYYMRESKRVKAEPFIGHFLWEYACHFPDRNAAFKSITSRLPFYIAMTLMRIARNTWISREYGHSLLKEALQNLQFDH